MSWLSYSGKEPLAKCPQLGHMLWCIIQPEESKFDIVTHSHYQIAFSVHTLEQVQIQNKSSK